MKQAGPSHVIVGILVRGWTLKYARLASHLPHGFISITRVYRNALRPGRVTREGDVVAGRFHLDSFRNEVHRITEITSTESSQVRRWRMRAAIALIVLFMVAGCDGGHNSSSAPPPASRSAVAATRTYMAGTGKVLLKMNAMASTIRASTSAEDCRGDATYVIRTVTLGGVSPNAVADTQLAELLADELSAVWEALAKCIQGEVNTATIHHLVTVRSAVEARLLEDGVKR